MSSLKIDKNLVLGTTWGLLLVFLSTSLCAQTAGTNGGDLLKVPLGVRPTAMGGVYSALGDDVYVMDYNPAGLARVSKYSLGLDHIQGFADIQTESLSLALPTKDYGNLGFQVVFRHMPDIQNVLATDPPVGVQDYLVTIADGQQFGPVAIGGSFKTLVSILGDKQAFTQAFDLGFKMQVLETDLAVAVQNVGPAVQYEPDPQGQDPLPLTFRFGIAKPLIVSPSSTLLAGGEAFYVNDEGAQAALGLEYWHRSLLALRIGYRFSDEGNLNGGFSAGAALRYNIGKLEYEIGYAWRPAQVSSGFIANSHIFGLLFWY
ncbi:MAG TPA: PorV/PorQ family protein [bacterium]|nr:PorV/PorQ family protein [bacterium]